MESAAIHSSGVHEVDSGIPMTPLKRVFENLFPFPKEVSKIIPSFFTIKEGSTFLTKPLFPQEREDVTALWCSEPLCSKVGGASEPSPGGCAGWDRLAGWAICELFARYETLL